MIIKIKIPDADQKFDCGIHGQRSPAFRNKFGAVHCLKCFRSLIITCYEMSLLENDKNEWDTFEYESGLDAESK
jgi:hypothetical protein